MVSHALCDLDATAIRQVILSAHGDAVTTKFSPSPIYLVCDNVPYYTL